MSTPFGGHPTLSEYLIKSRELGCTVKYGIRTGPDERPSRVILIEGLNGGYLPIVEMKDSEFLPPTTIARFDRRLNIDSGFFSINGETDQ